MAIADSPWVNGGVVAVLWVVGEIVGHSSVMKLESISAVHYKNNCG